MIALQAAEQDRFGRAMQKTRDTAVSRGCQNVFRPLEIDGVKFLAISFPHAGMSGQTIHLVDPGHRLLDERHIEHRPFDIVDCRNGPRWKPDVKHSHLPTTAEEL